MAGQSPGARAYATGSFIISLPVLHHLAMDVLANVLNVTHLTPTVHGWREFLPPWGIQVDGFGPSAVHIVRRGSCWLRHSDAEPMRLNAGDVVLLANGGAHTLSSERGMRDCEPYSQAMARSHNNIVPSLHGRPDQAAEPTVLQCASYQFSQEGFSQEGAHPLLSLLPPVIRMSADAVNNDSELQLLLRLLAQESTRREAGTDVVMPRLIDALFVYILRAWLRDQPEGSYGWLGALRDPQIRKALSLIHESPQVPWTVESLAQAAAMSRAAFAKRFAELVGEPPLTYVTRWRMDIAAKLLRESREPVARIASRVGYLSETAFAKAFRRRRKMPPGAYRYLRAGRASTRLGTIAPGL